jgi:hypothetical protein
MTTLDPREVLEYARRMSGKSPDELVEMLAGVSFAPGTKLLLKAELLTTRLDTPARAAAFDAIDRATELRAPSPARTALHLSALAAWLSVPTVRLVRAVWLVRVRGRPMGELEFSDDRRGEPADQTVAVVIELGEIELRVTNARSKRAHRVVPEELPELRRILIRKLTAELGPPAPPSEIGEAMEEVIAAPPFSEPVGPDGHRLWSPRLQAWAMIGAMDPARQRQPSRG